MRDRIPKIPSFSDTRNEKFEINKYSPGELTIPFLQQMHRQQPYNRHFKPTQMRIEDQVEEPEADQIITVLK